MLLGCYRVVGECPLSVLSAFGPEAKGKVFALTQAGLDKVTELKKGGIVSVEGQLSDSEKAVIAAVFGLSADQVEVIKCFMPEDTDEYPETFVRAAAFKQELEGVAGVILSIEADDILYKGIPEKAPEDPDDVMCLVYMGDDEAE